MQSPTEKIIVQYLSRLVVVPLPTPMTPGGGTLRHRLFPPKEKHHQHACRPPDSSWLIEATTRLAATPQSQPHMKIETISAVPRTVADAQGPRRMTIEREQGAVRPPPMSFRPRASKAQIQGRGVLLKEASDHDADTSIDHRV